MLSSFVHLQSDQKPAAPEYLDVVEILDQTSQDLAPLEREHPQQAAKAKYLGFGGAEVALTFKGPKSPVRFKSDQKLVFVVRTDNKGQDPTTLINIYKLQPTKDSRQLLLAKGGGFHRVQGTTDDSVVPITVTKYGDDAFKFSPTSPLAPGEYVAGTKAGADGFLFGVD
jgi:hypothetical protein